MIQEAASPTPLPLVVADDREQSSDVVAVLRTLKDIELVCQRLKSGDYEVGGWLFERKRLPDLAQSVVDGRLFAQARRLAGLVQPVAFILEGKSSDFVQIGVRREAIQGALISLSLIYQIPVLRALDAMETAHLLLYAAQQLDRERSGYSIRHTRRPKSRRKLQLYIAQGLPQIGPEKAERLLDHFGSVEKIMRAPENLLLSVRGIGPKIARQIRWILEPDFTETGGGAKST